VTVEYRTSNREFSNSNGLRAKEFPADVSLARGSSFEIRDSTFDISLPDGWPGGIDGLNGYKVS